MEKFFLSATLLFFISSHFSLSTSSNVKPQTYIIQMDTSEMPLPFPSHHSWYISTLSSLSSPEAILPVHLYTYTHVFSGFSAVLTASHLRQLESMPGHVSAHPETFGQLHTTHTPQFLGLDTKSGLWPAAAFGDDMIIGILDSGIWPESESFNDAGMPPVPARWRGACESGTAFTSENCNNKLIGARSFSKGIKVISSPDDYDSPRDFEGHGTHTSSTAAGSRAPFANYFGYANGTATGMAPGARIAMYKVLFSGSDENIDAAETDVLAGIDQAIEDGVDVMSMSLAFFTTPFYLDPIAIGSFAAMERGIFVACAAGNAGPHDYTVFNGAPWITTVGAGTVDRNLSASITLGETGIEVFGKSVFPESLLVDRVPLYFGHGNRSKETCETLDPAEVQGRYVFCDFSDGQADPLFTITNAGAAGVIFGTDSAQFLKLKDFNGPYVAINPSDAKIVKKFIMGNGDKSSNVSITFQVTLLGTKPAPQVAEFSSRGPVLHAPAVLKPDFLAPGVDILAAWAPNKPINAMVGDDYLLTDYAIVSGTSMACPHAAGVAALLKSVHKEWSSAAIRSAMMTTAHVIDNAYNPILDLDVGVSASPLDFGGGHLNPDKAMDPGLVYDIQIQDYVNYMCALNYTRAQLHTITRRSNVSCENANIDLNYPSFIVILNNPNATSASFRRTLTNVVDGNCTYSATVEAPVGMKVVVEPPVIHFPGKSYTSEFKLTVEIDLGNATRVNYLGNFGYLTWKEDNGRHAVRSPIVSAYPA